MIHTVNNCIRALGYTKFENVVNDFETPERILGFIQANGYDTYMFSEEGEMILIVGNLLEHTGCFKIDVQPEQPTPPPAPVRDPLDYCCYLRLRSTFPTQWAERGNKDYTFTTPSYDCRFFFVEPNSEGNYYDSVQILSLDEVQDTGKEFILMNMVYYSETNIQHAYCFNEDGGFYYTMTFDQGLKCTMNSGGEIISPSGKVLGCYKIDGKNNLKFLDREDPNYDVYRVLIPQTNPPKKPTYEGVKYYD